MKYTAYILIAFTIFHLNINTSFKKKRNNLIGIQEALAATVLSASSLDYTTTAGRANWIRYLYFTVNGAADGYEMEGVNFSYLALLNTLLGPDGLGGVLTRNGYSSCSSLPSTGADVVENIDLTFSAGELIIPSHFESNAGETFDKRITFAEDGANFLRVEFKCDTTSTVESGYLYFENDGEHSTADFEVYFQRDSASNQLNVDVAFGQTGIKSATRFSTADGSSFSLYIANTSSSYNSATAISGVARGKVNVNFLNVNSLSEAAASITIDDISSITNSSTQFASSDCIDLATDTTADTACDAIPTPGSIIIGGTATAFTLNAINSATFTSLN